MKKRTYDITPPVCSFCFAGLRNRRELDLVYENNTMEGGISVTAKSYPVLQKMRYKNGVCII